MKVYRLVRECFMNDFSGKGASLFGGRWNSIGTEIIYTASNRSLAMAELVVHLTLATLPDDFYMLEILLPTKSSKKKIDPIDLPENWNAFPSNNLCAKIGDDFINQNKYLLLEVPSAVTKGDFNILINPFHKDFKKVKILSSEKFPFDKRIFK
jgi:RES domain-containing protein